MNVVMVMIYISKKVAQTRLTTFVKFIAHLPYFFKKQLPNFILSILLAHDLERDAARTRAVQFDGKNPLPLSQLQVILQDIHHRGSRQMDRFVMRVAVSALAVAHIDGADLEIVVGVLVGARRQFFQQFFHIGDQQRLGFVDDDGHGGVERLDVDHALGDAGLFDLLADFVGDVDKIQGGGGGQLDDVVYDFHIF